MTRTNIKMFIGKDDEVVCPKCKLNLSVLKEDPYIAYDNWDDNNGIVTCSAEEYVICSNCGYEVVLSTWTENF